jgi:hypothetical protein
MTPETFQTILTSLEELTDKELKELAGKVMALQFRRERIRMQEKIHAKLQRMSRERL